MKDKLEDLKAQRLQLQKELKTILQNKETSLEERWSLFESYGESVLEVNSWVENFEILGEDFCYYDNFFTERREKLLYTTLVESFEDRIDDDFYEDERKLTREQINDLKEEMLRTGHCGFIFDW